MSTGGHVTSSVSVSSLRAAGAGSSRSMSEVRAIAFDRSRLALIATLCAGVVEVAAVTLGGVEGTTRVAILCV